MIYKLAIMALFALLTVVHAQSDPRILAITHTDGTIWLNPDANKFVHDAVCTDTYSRLKAVCASVCSPTSVSFFASQKAYYDYSYSHYDVRNYLLIWQSLDPNALMNHDLKLSKFYQSQIDSCAICTGIKAVAPVGVIG